MMAYNNTNFKIMLCGDGGVGKTQLASRLQHEEFDGRYVATLGVEVNPLVIYAERGTAILNLWDLAGQDKFRGLGSRYYSHANAIVISFDLTSIETLRNCNNWITEAGVDGPRTAMVVLVGLKKDCRGRTVSVGDVRALFPYMTYFEVSNLSGEGVSQLRTFLYQMLVPGDIEDIAA